MTATDSSPAGVSVRGNLVIGVASIAVGAAVIPYGASMPYVREGIPGPGLFPMMIGGLLIIFGVLILVTSLLSVRRDRIHGEQMAAAEAGNGSAVADGTAADTATETAAATTSAGAAPAAGVSAEGTTPATTGPGTEDVTGVPDDADDVPENEMVTKAVMDTDIGSNGIRRWINGAILMGGILFYVFFAEILGFPLTMAILVTAIVGSLRAKWWVAVLTGVLTALGLWAMFEQGLMVQLPDGPFKGF